MYDVSCLFDKIEHHSQSSNYCIGNQLLLLHEIEYKAAPQQTSVDNIDILVVKQIR